MGVGSVDFLDRFLLAAKQQYVGIVSQQVSDRSAEAARAYYADRIKWRHLNLMMSVE
ncbi:MAG: hypothetical protein OHK0019_22440 [Saprospiraceae bacterium]